MIRQKIQSQLKEAMKAKDTLKLETLRFLLSEIKYEEIAKQRDLTDEEETNILIREVKKRREAIILFKNSSREQLVSEEETKLLVINSFLPARLTSEELEKIIDAVLSASSDKNFGAIMREVILETKGRADGKLISDLVKQKLS